MAVVLPLPDGAAAWWLEERNDGLPGAIAAVEYRDDHVRHERLLLWPSRVGCDPTYKHRWHVLTPDRDVLIEDLSGGTPDAGPSEAAVRMPGDGADLDDGKAPVYRFRVYPTADQMKAYM